MFKILGILFLMLIVVLLIGLSLIVRVAGSLFGNRRPPYRQQARGEQPHRQSATGNSRQETVETEEGSLHPKHKKLFDKDEGEYVDYEEIKE